MHGSPCQDISLAGRQKGADKDSGTRSSLMYETIRIVKKLKPKYVIWENVKNLISKKHIHNFNAYLDTLNELGYKNYYQVLNSKDYGIPQNRERVFTISIRNDIEKDFIFPPKQELKLRLKDLLEDEVDENFYLTEKQIEQISYWKSYRQPIQREREREYTYNNSQKQHLTKCKYDLIKREHYLQWYQKGHFESQCRAWYGEYVGALPSSKVPKIMENEN